MEFVQAISSVVSDQEITRVAESAFVEVFKSAPDVNISLMVGEHGLFAWTDIIRKKLSQTHGFATQDVVNTQRSVMIAIARYLSLMTAITEGKLSVSDGATSFDMSHDEFATYINDTAGDSAFKALVDTMLGRMPPHEAFARMLLSM